MTQPATTTGSPDTTATEPAPNGTGPASGEVQTGGHTDQQAERIEDLPGWAQKVVREARAGEAKARTEAKATAAAEARTAAEQEMAQKIGRALGLVKDGDDRQADPAQVAQQVTTLTSENRALAVELAVWKAAKKAGANAQALTDSRSFLDRLSKLDPTADDFATQLQGAIKKAVDDNPQYREAGQAPARSGGEFTGGPGGDAVTSEQFRRMTGAQRNELFKTDPALYRKLAGR